MTPKKFLCILLAFAQVFWSTAVFASELDESVKMAKSLRDNMRDSFLPYLRSSTISNFKTNYLMMSWDHTSTQNQLAIRSYEGLQKLQSFQSEFDVLMDKLKVYDDLWEDNAVRALSLVAQIQGLSFDSGRVVENAQLLKDSWSSQCNERSVDQYSKRFSPLATYPIKELGKTPTSPDPNIEFNLSVSGSYGDNGVSANPSGSRIGDPNSDGAEASGILITVGTALLFTGEPYSAVVGIVLIAVGVIVGLASAMKQAVADAKKKGELADLKNEIYLIQMRGIRQVHAEMPEIVMSSCKKSFPKEQIENLTLEIFSKYLSETEKVYGEVKAKRNEIYRLYSGRIQFLETEYFPKVQATYLSLVESRWVQSKKTRLMINHWITEEVGPQIQAIQKSKGSNSRQLWRSQQKLWDNIIQGDSQFRTHSNFSFTRKILDQEETEGLDSFWNDFAPKLKRVMQ